MPGAEVDLPAPFGPAIRIRCGIIFMLSPIVVAQSAPRQTVLCLSHALLGKYGYCSIGIHLYVSVIGQMSQIGHKHLAFESQSARRVEQIWQLAYHDSNSDNQQSIRLLHCHMLIQGVTLSFLGTGCLLQPWKDWVTWRW
jgi:hypothetical protein